MFTLRIGRITQVRTQSDPTERPVRSVVFTRMNFGSAIHKVGRWEVVCGFSERRDKMYGAFRGESHLATARARRRKRPGSTCDVCRTDYIHINLSLSLYIYIYTLIHIISPLIRTPPAPPPYNLTSLGGLLMRGVIIGWVPTPYPP